MCRNDILRYSAKGSGHLPLFLKAHKTPAQSQFYLCSVCLPPVTTVAADCRQETGSPLKCVGGHDSDDVIVKGPSEIDTLIICLL